ncbi:ABC transporter permease [Paenibacillus hemerocallicola]|jgi:ABC-type transport system involved in multi-copper enzyme maturation permease subunit|uniref:ABC transporter permease n=1 Tax=Paenibacillus hemerocallicola TaxID=1172614 RepID=A0A5C4T519_9BACL|nr:ABC transporter permease [Paenibacillus hemerocallicola]TNJ64162.1 ABC transporter permease [Paenibacillus hemerocallicola]
MNWRQKWINPVLEKEFRLRMRTIRSPLALLAYLVVIGLLALGYIYMEMHNRGSRGFTPESSRMLFYFLSGAQLVLVCFMAPGLTAGVISGEREKQTLNILLTTQQSSTTIIMSKLFSALSFMFLIVFATLPVYSIVFLFGGISPGQLVAVFGFYVLVMIALGSLGVLFSTLLKKTVVSLIVTYGVGLFLYVFTGLAAIFIMSVTNNSARELSGFLIAINPLAAMISIFEPNFSQEFFRGTWSALELWHLFIPVHVILSVVSVLLAIRFLRPRLKRR